uniref:Uncharacterized protein n=1 Tax=Oryza brachyantha TaxID=4533 RepID=J3M5W4_ORYBR
FIYLPLSLIKKSLLSTPSIENNLIFHSPHMPIQKRRLKTLYSIKSQYNYCLLHLFSITTSICLCLY